MDQRFVQALSSRGVDVKTVTDAQRLGLSDEEQLAFASKVGRALYTFNVGLHQVVGDRLIEDFA
ncbi:MAG: DUF5615 family PIN-like protein [Cyanobacteria bacterium P01_G01_bin.38]